MKKILPIYFVMMFCSFATFGQNKFIFKSFPDSSGLFEPLPIYPDIRISGPNWLPIVPEKSDEITFFKKDQLLSIRSFKVPPDAEAYPGILQNFSNMPIIDLSKGFSSNFIIKGFPDFRSNMPIVQGKSSVP